MEDQEIIRQLEAQFRPLFESSPDGVYLWLDESHKVCNERLASLYGMSVAEWCTAEPFLESFVAAEDREHYAWNYHHRVGGLLFPTTFRFRGLRRDGSTFNAETDMIPISFDGRPVAYHFVRQLAG